VTCGCGCRSFAWLRVDGFRATARRGLLDRTLRNDEHGPVGHLLLLRQVANGLDIVAVGVAYEGTVVVGVIFGPKARLVQHLGPKAVSSIEELANCCTTWGGERDVGLPKTFPVERGPIQNSGFESYRSRRLVRKSMMRLPPSGARTRRRTRRWPRRRHTEFER